MMRVCERRTQCVIIHRAILHMADETTVNDGSVMTLFSANTQQVNRVSAPRVYTGECGQAMQGRAPASRCITGETGSPPPRAHHKAAVRVPTKGGSSPPPPERRTFTALGAPRAPEGRTSALRRVPSGCCQGFRLGEASCVPSD